MNSGKQRFEVHDSAIHGVGLFAAMAFKRGQTIAYIKGNRFKFSKKNPPISLSEPNWIGIGAYEWIDSRNGFQYINHSCDPNVSIRGKVTVVAIKDISPGEELTLDYSTTETDPGWYMENLEKKGKYFRPIVRSIQFLPERAYKRYCPYLPTHIKTIYEREVLLKKRGNKA